MENEKLRVPLNFEIVDSYDDRFLKVKIKLMHLGENLNGSYFSKEAVEKATPTLANTPILGFISPLDPNDQDSVNEFNGHEMHLEKKDNEYKMVYDGQAYGVIPESCNPRFELEGEKVFLVVDGIMWTKFSEATEILERNGENAQSMELDKDYDGFFRKDGLFEFTDFKFYGACILGDARGVQPAMTGASVTPIFALDEIKDKIAIKLEEFYSSYSLNDSKEVGNMTLEELLAKYSVTVEQLQEKGIVAEEFSIEELEVKIQEVFAQDSETEDEEDVKEDVEEEVEEDVEDEENPEGENFNSDESVDGSVEPQEGDVEPEETFEDNNNPEEENVTEGEFEASESEPEKVVREFTLSHTDIRVALWHQLDSFVVEKGLGECWDFWIADVFDDHMIIEHEGNRNFFKVYYTKENDVVQLGDFVQVYAQFLTAEEKGALELMRNNYETLESEVNQLKEYKVNVEKASHEAKAENLFSQFGLSEDEVSTLRENVHNFTIDELEEKLFALVGRKNFSAKIERPNKVAVSIEDKGNVSEESYMQIFAKYGLKK